MTDGPDEISPLYRAIRLVGAMALLIFAAGIVEFLSFEPPGQATGTVVRVSGVYAYDAEAHATSGQPKARFGRDEPFAAVVEWSSLPASTEVAARWFDSFGEVVGAVGPRAAGSMPSTAFPVALPQGLTRNIPGTYLFVVERIASGQAVEVLARSLVEVDRT